MSHASGSSRLVTTTLFLVWVLVAAALAFAAPPAAPIWPALLLAGMLLQACCIVGVQRSSNTRLAAALTELVQRLSRPAGEGAPVPADHAAALRLGLDDHEAHIDSCLRRVADTESDKERSTANEGMNLLEKALKSLQTQLTELASTVGVAQTPESDDGLSASKLLERLATAIAAQKKVLGRFDQCGMVTGSNHSVPDAAASSLDHSLNLLRERLIQSLALLAPQPPATVSDLDTLSTALATVVARQRVQLENCRVLVDGHTHGAASLEKQAQALEVALHDARYRLRTLVEALGATLDAADAAPLVVLAQSGDAARRLVAGQLTHSLGSLGHAANDRAARDDCTAMAAQSDTSVAANLLAQSIWLAALTAENRRTIECCRVLVDSAAQQGAGPETPARLLQFLLEQVRDAAARSHATVGGTPDEPNRVEEKASLSSRLAGIDEAHRHIVAVTLDSLSMLGERRDDAAASDADDGQLRLDIEAVRLNRQSDKAFLNIRKLENQLAEERAKLKKEENEKEVQMQIAYLISHDISRQTDTLLNRVRKIANLWDIADRARKQLVSGALSGSRSPGAEFTSVAHLCAVIDSAVHADDEPWSKNEIAIVPAPTDTTNWEVYFNEDHFRAIVGGLLTNAVTHGSEVTVSFTIEPVGTTEAEAVVSVANKVGAAAVPALCARINGQIADPKVSMKEDNRMHGGTFFLAKAAALSMDASFRCVPGDKVVMMQFRRAEDARQDGRLLLTNAMAPNSAAAFRCLPGDKAIAVQFRTRARRLQ